MFVIREIKCTCSACPSQWEGKLVDGRHIYIRYRWGYLYVNVEDKQVFDRQIGDELDGILSYKQLKNICKGNFMFPEPEGGEIDD